MKNSLCLNLPEIIKTTNEYMSKDRNVLELFNQDNSDSGFNQEATGVMYELDDVDTDRYNSMLSLVRQDIVSIVKKSVKEGDIDLLDMYTHVKESIHIKQSYITYISLYGKLNHGELMELVNDARVEVLGPDTP